MTRTVAAQSPRWRAFRDCFGRVDVGEAREGGGCVRCFSRNRSRRNLRTIGWRGVVESASRSFSLTPSGAEDAVAMGGRRPAVSLETRETESVCDGCTVNVTQMCCAHPTPERLVAASAAHRDSRCPVPRSANQFRGLVSSVLISRSVKLTSILAEGLHPLPWGRSFLKSRHKASSPGPTATSSPDVGADALSSDSLMAYGRGAEQNECDRFLTSMGLRRDGHGLWMRRAVGRSGHAERRRAVSTDVDKERRIRQHCAADGK